MIMLDSGIVRAFASSHNTGNFPIGQFFAPRVTRSILARSAASPPVEVAPTAADVRVEMDAGHMGSPLHEPVERSGPRSTRALDRPHLRPCCLICRYRPPR